MLCFIHNQGNASFHTFLGYFCPSTPIFSILLLSYFSFFTMMSRALSSSWPSGGAVVLWNIRGGSPNYLLNCHFPQNLCSPTPLQHGAIVILCRVKRGLAPSWVPHFTFELPSSLFVDSSC